MNGYLYIAYGTGHVNEACASVESLRKVDPGAHVTLISDRFVDGFDRIIVKSDFRPIFSGKVDNLTNELYDNTFYVDTDTYFCEDCSPLFDLLKYFDLCAMMDPGEPGLDKTGFTSYNTGVLLIRRTLVTSSFLALFRQYYNDDMLMAKVLKDHPAGRFRTDQPAFSLAIRDTDAIKTYPLSSVWNARYRFSISLLGSVKLIHGPDTDFEDLRKRMNYNLKNRIWEQGM